MPIFEDSHGYTGELLPLNPPPVCFNPLLDMSYDCNKLRDEIYGQISSSLAHLSYYNDCFNPRSAGGMLSFCFRDKTDAQNRLGAATRAKAHNANYILPRGQKNAALLKGFLHQMEQEGRRVILFVPPVTDFYRAAVLDEMREQYDVLMRPINENGKHIFIDLFSSDIFVRDDFQDYDHLNDVGAAKLSDILSAYCI